MKRSTLFWGVFLILSGIFLILDKLSIWNIDFNYFSNYWALLLVFWGISLLKIPDIIRKIMVILSAALLSIFLSGFIANGFSSIFNCNDDYIISNKTYQNKYHKTAYYSYDNNIKFAKLSIDAGAFNIHIKGKSDDLISVYSYSPKKYIDLDTKTKSDKVKLNLDFKLSNLLWRRHKIKNRVDINLNTNPIWDFDLDMGAVNFRADLSNYNVKKIKIDVGASNVKLKLGDYYYQTDMEIDAGASNISVKIPKESYCEINSETGLSSKDFNGFIKVGGKYRTENPDNFSNKIFIDIQGGVSKFAIIRY